MGKEIFFRKDLPSVMSNIQASQPDNTIDSEVELTFEQQQVLTEILEAYRANPSNSNKYRYNLFAQVDKYLAQEANKALTNLSRSFIDIADYKGYMVKQIIQARLTADKEPKQ